jgi:hypothetical protein
MKFKLNLETSPTWALFITFASFFVFFGLFVAFGVMGPSPYTPSTKSLQGIDPTDFERFLNGKVRLEVTQDDLKTINSEFYFFVYFYPSSTLNPLTGFTQDLKVNITLYGKSFSGESILITPKEGIVHDRTLTCGQAQGNSPCAPILLVNMNTIQYNTYIIQFTILPQAGQVLNLFEPKLDAVLVFANWEYSFYELIFRYFFTGMTIFVLLFFVAFTRWKQYFYEWHTEQKWIAILLISLIGYNNPLYIFQFFTFNWVYPFFNIIFRVTFICFMLLILLVTTQSMYIKPIDRTFFKFYIGKIALVGSLWYLLMMSFTWATFQGDPAFSFSEDSRSYKILLGLVVSLLISYGVTLLYYIIRIIGLWSKLPSKYTSKFGIVWGMTLFIVVVFFGILVILYLTNALKASVGFLAFQVVFNYYTFILAFLFLPSWQKEEISNYEIAPESLIGGDGVDL